MVTNLKQFGGVARQCVPPLRRQAKRKIMRGERDRERKRERCREGEGGGEKGLFSFKVRSLVLPRCSVSKVKANTGPRF